MNHDIINKFKSKPRSIKIKYDGEATIYLKPVSYNLMIFLRDTTVSERDRFLTVIKQCWCDELGTSVFDQDTELEYIGGVLDPVFVAAIANSIIDMVSRSEVDKKIVGKPANC